MADYTPLSAIKKVAAALTTAKAWEKNDLFWWRCTGDPGCGPRKEWYVVRLGPARANGDRQVVISIKGVLEEVFWIKEKEDKEALAEADRLLLQYIEKNKVEITVTDVKWIAQATPEPEVAKAPAPVPITAPAAGEKMKSSMETPTQTVVWNAIKNGAAQTVARYVEVVIFKHVKKSLLERFPALALLDNAAVDELVMFLLPVGVREFCIRHEEGFLGLKAEHVSHLVTACDYAIQANSNKIMELMMETILPAMSRLVDVGKKLADAGDNPLQISSLMNELKAEIARDEAVIITESIRARDMAMAA